MNFLNDLNNYIVVIVLVACLCVGYILKHLVTSDKINKYIPAILGLLGMFMNTWLNQWVVTPDILVGGLVSGLASTGMHQAFKQFLESRGTVE